MDGWSGGSLEFFTTKNTKDTKGFAPMLSWGSGMGVIGSR
jgi:hypothetical protein